MKEIAAESGKSYWRSLDRLLDSPAVREQLMEEFPKGACDAPRGFDRRTMLKLMAASFGLAGLASCRRPEENIVPYVSAPETLTPGIAKYYATAMPLGTGAYGLLVESYEGRPTKIEGNELHPSSEGAANIWMQAAILDLYDPDRSRGLLRRTETENDFKPASWEDFHKFWIDHRIDLINSGGKGLAVLTDTYSSPTQARLAALFQERFPNAHWVAYEPLSDENVFEGIRMATGKALRPVYHLDRAKIVVALDADFLAGETDNVINARRLGSRRKVLTEQDAMNRLYVVEGSLSLTGCNADHRVPLQSRKVPSFLTLLVTELKRLGLHLDFLVPGPSTPALSDQIHGYIKIIARELIDSGAESLLLAGSRQPAEVHAVTMAINKALGSLGQTVTLYELKDVGWGKTGEIRTLIKAMREGTVSMLFMLGGNPIYNTPADLDFEKALRSVRYTIHLSDHLDETSERVGWHLPKAHFLESWGDIRATAGSASVIQPLIMPLFGGRSTIEVLGFLVSDNEVKGYELVRDTWLQNILGGDDFEARWRRVVHDGVMGESSFPATDPELQTEEVQKAFVVLERSISATDRGGLEVEFRASHAVYDGRFANNGWLQELPDPVSKITWDNAALISPNTAQNLGVESEHVIRLKYRGSLIEAPAFILPGQADGAVTISLGYGRSSVGRVGNGVGFNAYRLRHSSAPYFDGGLEIQKTDRNYELALTQDHWAMEGRSIIREATLSQYRENPLFASEPEINLKASSLWQERIYEDGYQWGMAIDLNSCVGCNACVVACQSENNIPIVGKEQVARGREMHWLRVDRYFSGSPREPKVLFQPVPCMHCENAPCEEVCPVGATLHDQEGLNVMVFNRCIGTRYCSNNCPYKVRRFNFFNYTKDLPEVTRMAMNPNVTVRSRGVMEKCSYCLQRINQAKINSKQQGRLVGDGEIKTACQQTCPTGAIVFGNINDPESRVSKLKRQNRNYKLLAELETKPRTSYLANLRNPNPDWGKNA